MMHMWKHFRVQLFEAEAHAHSSHCAIYLFSLTVALDTHKLVGKRVGSMSPSAGTLVVYKTCQVGGTIGSVAGKKKSIK